MSRRHALLLFDSTMFSLFLALVSWRLTGLAWHEALGLALIGLIFVHLLIHWGWVESRVLDTVRRSRRRMGGLLLNAGLFIAMGATLISGVVISKVALPNQLAPVAYLKWHGVHESATTFTLILLGVHLALNWDRILVSVRARAARLGWRLVSPAAAVRRAASVLLAFGALTSGLWAYEILDRSSPEVVMVFPDGRREHRAPPPEITRAWAGANRPAPKAGLPRAILSLVLLAGAGLVGRPLLTRRRRRINGLGRQPAPKPPAQPTVVA